MNEGLNDWFIIEEEPHVISMFYEPEPPGILTEDNNVLNIVPYIMITYIDNV